jgi:hypothetical protein
MSRTHLVGALAACCVCTILQAQAPVDFLQAAKARDQAIDKVDIAAWERLTAPEFTEVLETGRLLTRLEVRAKPRNQKPAAAAFVCGEERITTFANGNAATRRCLSEGNWWLEVWVRSGGVWQAVAAQGTPAAK